MPVTRSTLLSTVAAPAAPLAKTKFSGRKHPRELKLSRVSTPVGPMSLAASNDGLHVADFGSLWDCDPEAATGDEPADNLIREAKVQIQEYFAGSRKEFTIPLVPEGTVFQKKAWEALARIPYGKTWCYEEQALSMNEPGKARAVGAANGKNPICLFLPCHRVIAKGGGLCGFGAGLKIKKYLLDLESGKSPV